MNILQTWGDVCPCNNYVIGLTYWVIRGTFGLFVVVNEEEKIKKGLFAHKG